jgi:hypothetical protein
VGDLEKNFLDIANQHVPLTALLTLCLSATETKVKSAYSPWMTNDIKKHSYHAQRLFKKESG